MKKYLIALICAVFAAFASIAETHYKPHISIGAKGGASLSEIDFSPSLKQMWNSGTTGAVTFRYTEEKLFGLIAELGWVQRGWREDYEGAPLLYRRTLNYVNLPVLTHIYFGSRRFKGFVNLGPQVSFLLSDNIVSDFDYHNPLDNPDFPKKNRMTEQMVTPVNNRFDYGICGGVGMEFYVSPRNSILVEGRYYFGLGNIFPATKADTFGASRPMSIEITLGYFFRLK